MQRFFLACAITLVFFPSCRGHVPWRDDPAIFAAPSVLFHYREDFRNGEVNGWDSYPPAQDTAFDPTFECVATATGPVLQKQVVPTVDGPAEAGVIKKIACDVGPHATVRFRAEIRSTSPTVSIAVILCAADGRRLTALTTAPIDRWSTLTLRGNDFGIAVPTRIQAVIISAVVNNTPAGTAHALRIDDVEIAAHRPARVEVIAPKSTFYRHWDIAVIDKPYRGGETLAIRAMPEARVRSLTAALVDPTGKAAGERVTLKPTNNGATWSGDVRRFAENDPTGLWELRLAGSTLDGRPIETTILLILSHAVPPHPRVLATSSEIAAIREDVRGKKKELWARFRATASQQRAEFKLPAPDLIENLDHRELLPTFLAYAVALRKTTEFICLQSLVYTVDGDIAAGTAAKETLLALCGWKRWVHPWAPAHGLHTYWPVGVASSDVAIGYDLLYPLLTPPEREIVRRAMLEKAILPAYREYVLADRIPFDTSNWTGIILGGALACAAAIADETDVDVYVNGFMLKLRNHLRASFRPDEGYGEGLGYQGFDLKYLTRGLCSIEKAFGIDLATPAALDRCAPIYPYTLIAPEKGSIVFGDCNRLPIKGAAPGLAWLSARFADPVLDWLYRTTPPDGDPLAMANALLYLNDDGSNNDPRPSLPPSRSFPGIGVTVLRSDWTENARMVAFKCGPNYNHHHIDQGSFQVWAHGEELLTEAGVTDYYEDPNYATFFIQPAGHNCLIVDDNPESQRIGDFASDIAALTARASVASFWSTEGVDHVRGILHPVYREKLRDYTREFFFLKPGSFIMVDRVETDGTPRQLEWRFHAPDMDSIRTAESGFSVIRPRARLDATVISDAPLAIAVHPSPVPIRQSNAHPGHLRIRANGPAIRATMMTVMTPTAADATSAVTPLAEDGAIGCLIVDGTNVDTFWMRNDSGAPTTDLGGLATDARAWLMRSGKNEATLALWNVTAATSATLTLQSERPISIAVTWRNGRMTAVEYRADSAHKLTAGSLTLETLPGAHRVEIPESAERDRE